MIVEFVGAPGAGKSTLIDVARKVLCDRGLKAMFRMEASVYCLRRTLPGRILCAITPQRWQQQVLWALFRRLVWCYRLKILLTDRQLVRRAMALLPDRPISRKDKRKIRDYFFRYASYYRFFRKHLRPGEVLILSEGLVHRVTSLHSSGFEEPDPARISQYLSSLPQTDLVIWVQTSPDNCVARVVSRGGHARYAGEELSSFITSSHKSIEIALQGVKELGWNVIEVNNDGEVSYSIADLQYQLNERKAELFISG